MITKTTSLINQLKLNTIKNIKNNEEATHSLNKFDKLASKLSGIILILLLFNRLQNISNKHMLQTYKNIIK